MGKYGRLLRWNDLLEGIVWGLAGDVEPVLAANDVEAPVFAVAQIFS
jgi:hypothetical protein